MYDIETKDYIRINDVVFTKRDDELVVHSLGYFRLKHFKPINATDINNITVARCCDPELGCTNQFVIWVSDELRYRFKSIAGDTYMSVRLLDLSNRTIEYDLIDRLVNSYEM